MTNKPNTKYFFPLIAVIAVVLIAAGWLLYGSRTSRLEELNKDLQDQKKELQALQEDIRQQATIKREHAALEQDLSVLEPSVPTYAYIPTFLRQIEEVAIATNNTIRGIRPIPQRKTPTPAPSATGEEGGTAAGQPAGTEQTKKAEPKLPYDSVGIEVKLQGTYWSLVNFLERLRKFPKLIAINDMDVRPGTTGSEAYQSPQLTIELQMVAVVMKGSTKWTSAKKN